MNHRNVPAKVGFRPCGRSEIQTFTARNRFQSSISGDHQLTPGKDLFLGYTDGERGNFRDEKRHGTKLIIAPTDQASPRRGSPILFLRPLRTSRASTAGTIFHKPPAPLRVWFYAIYLMSSIRCGISAKQIQRETGVTYKTAWRMFTKIGERLADDSIDPVVGPGKQVEADKSYHGGKRKRGAGRPLHGDPRQETPVPGMDERKGRSWPAQFQIAQARRYWNASRLTSSRKAPSTPVNLLPTAALVTCETARSIVALKLSACLPKIVLELLLSKVSGLRATYVRMR